MNRLTVNHIDNPDLRPLKVFMWYSGQFPVLGISTHSFSLPKMLWPNATFYIRCRKTKKTQEWIAKRMKDVSYILIDDDKRPEEMSLEKYDIIYNHDYFFRSIGHKWFRNSQDYEDINYIVYNINKPIYFLFCDKEVCHKVENTPVFLNVNEYPWVKNCLKKKDFSNLHILFNQDICRDWAIECIDWASFSGATELPKIDYLNMRLYYQLPDEYTPKSYTDEKKGCYFGMFFDSRIQFFNTVLNTPGEKKLNLELGGRGISRIKGTKYYREDCVEKFPHEEIFERLKPYDWAMFIGRVTPLDYLGMTFYLPFVVGMPVFCLRTCFEGVGNPFEGIDCFFSTEDELATLVEKTDLRKLFEEQTSRLKTLYYHD